MSSGTRNDISKQDWNALTSQVDLFCRYDLLCPVRTCAACVAPAIALDATVATDASRLLPARDRYVLRGVHHSRHHGGRAAKLRAGRGRLGVRHRVGRDADPMVVCETPLPIPTGKDRKSVV